MSSNPSATPDFVYSTSFNIPADENRYRLQLQITDDDLNENVETFVLTISTNDVASITLSQTTIIIIDADPTTTEAPTTAPCTYAKMS